MARFRAPAARGDRAAGLALLGRPDEADAGQGTSHQGLKPPRMTLHDGETDLTATCKPLMSNQARVSDERRGWAQSEYQSRWLSSSSHFCLAASPFDPADKRRRATHHAESDTFVLTIDRTVDTACPSAPRL